MRREGRFSHDTSIVPGQEALRPSVCQEQCSLQLADRASATVAIQDGSEALAQSLYLGAGSFLGLTDLQELPH